MTKLVAIDSKAHKNLIINTDKCASHAEHLNLIPVVVAELDQVALQQAIVFVKNQETGAFTLSALMGFEQTENLFYQQNQWQGIYLPLQVQRQPFFVGDTQSNQSQYSICINLDSTAIENDANLTDSNNLKSLFTTEGKDSDYFVQIKQCLGYLLQGELDNEKLIESLLSLDLMQTVSLEVTFCNGKKIALKGLYTIDKEKLAALSAEHIVKLHQQQLLPAIYTIIFSLGQIYPLIERKNALLNNTNDNV